MTDTAPADTATDTTSDAAPADAADTDTTDWKAEAEKAKALQRKWEDRAKQNSNAAKELEDLRKQSMTEQERAVAEAVAQARTQTLAEVGSHLAAAEVRVAAAGRLDDDQLNTLIDSIDLPRFLNEDGTVDTGKVKALVDGIAPAATDQAPPDPFKGLDLGQGSRTPAVALNSDELLKAVMDKVGPRKPR